MKIPSIICAAFCCLLFNVGNSLAGPPKIIIDTDFNTIGDDGQVAVMAAQLYAQGPTSISLALPSPRATNGAIKRSLNASKRSSGSELKTGSRFMLVPCIRFYMITSLTFTR